MALHAGSMDRLVTVQQSTVAKDDYKDKVTTWSTIASVWAQVINSPMGERNEAENRVAVLETKFRVRYYSAITANMRIVFGGKYYYITGVEEKGRREAMILTTEQRDSENGTT